MRRFTIIGLVGAFVVSSSTALAHDTKWAWPAWKAKQRVLRDATVRLPAGERVALLQELRESVRLYKALLLATSHSADGDVEGTYKVLLARYTAALYQVENGLDVAAASCRGTGSATEGVRFRHFRCAVTSGTLEIPTATLDYSVRDLPLVIEGPPRIVGPRDAALDIHVTGRSSIAYLQAE